MPNTLQSIIAHRPPDGYPPGRRRIPIEEAERMQRIAANFGRRAAEHVDQILIETLKETPPCPDSHP